MRYLKAFFLLFLLIPFFSLAQSGAKYLNDSSRIDKGFDFMVSGGVYFANKYNADYYNGSPQNENGLDYIFKNKYWYDDINQLMIEKYSYISDSVFLGDLPQNMSYDPNMSISFGFRYKFNKNWGISLFYSYTKITASDRFYLDYKTPSGNIRPGYISEYLVGQESRSVFDLSTSYLFQFHSIVKPFVEFGVQFNFVDVKKYIALIEGKEYNLLDYYQGAYYTPNSQMQKFDTKYGGPGFGFSFSTGIKLAFNKFFSIDPTFYLSASSFGLTGYKNIALNYGALVRIFMSDLVFSK